MINLKKIIVHSTDLKIFELIELLKATKVIKSTAAFCREIGFLRQNIRRVKSGDAHFTLQHLAAISKAYDVNANYIIGTSNTKFNSLKNAHKMHTKHENIA
jgi:hypothetical protein